MPESRQTLIEHAVSNAHISLNSMKADGGVMGQFLEMAIKADVNAFFQNVEFPLQPEDIAMFTTSSQLQLAKLSAEMGIPIRGEILTVCNVILTGFIIERIHA